MEKFPELPMFQGIYAPSRIEVDLHDLEVEGQLPRDRDDSSTASPAPGIPRQLDAR